MIAAIGLPQPGCNRPKDDAVPGPRAPRSVPVRTATVEARDIEERLELTGTLKPRAQVTVVAEVAARLVRLLKDEGMAVRKDELVAVLDDTDYRLLQDRAQAAVAVAEANRAHALTERERADNLIKTGGITDKDRLAAQVALQVSDAALAQARAEAAIAAQQRARCQVHAPFSGHVARRFSDAGTVLAAGNPILALVDDSELEVRASVASIHYDRIRLGASVDVTVDSLPDFSTRGQIARILPMVDERSRSFEVVVRVPGHRDLVSGLFARAAVRVRNLPGALVVPPGALVRDGARPDRAQAFVVADGKADRREVTLGVERVDAIQVTSGLQAGDIVVVDPPVSLASGAPVTIQNGDGKS